MVQQHEEKASHHSALTLFYCYARKDKVLRDEIDIHLASLHRSELITSWHDAMIVPGEDWEHEIDTHLNAASIILLLVSPDFLNSDYCYSREMLRAIERHNRGEAHVIPILIRSTYLINAPFSTIQMLPTNAKPVTQWADYDAAFTDIAHGVHCAVNELIKQKHLQEEEQKRLQEEEQKRLQAETLIERGKALQAQKRYEEALPLFERAVQLAPRSSDAWGHLGRTLDSLNRIEEEQKRLRAETFIRRGKTLNVWERYEEALNTYDQALSLNPNMAFAWTGKGHALHNLQRYEEAIDAYDHALSLDPDMAAAWYNKGAILYHLKRYEEALNAYDHVLSLDPNMAAVWSNKAITLRLLGRTSEAQVAERHARQFQGS